MCAALLGPILDEAQVERENPLPGTMSDRILEPLSLVPISGQASNEGEKLVSGPVSDQSTEPLPLGPMSDQYVCEKLVLELMSGRTPKPLSLIRVSNQSKEEREKFLLDVMLDQIQEIAKSESPI